MAPPNNAYGSATDLGDATSGSEPFDLVLATEQASDPYSGDTEGSVWFTWTCPATPDLESVTFATATATGGSVDGWTPLGWGYDAARLDFLLEFDSDEGEVTVAFPQPGITYRFYLYVWSGDTESTGTLDWTSVVRTSVPTSTLPAVPTLQPSPDFNDTTPIPVRDRLAVTVQQIGTPDAGVIQIAFYQASQAGLVEVARLEESQPAGKYLEFPQGITYADADRDRVVVVGRQMDVVSGVHTQDRPVAFVAELVGAEVLLGSVVEIGATRTQADLEQWDTVAESLDDRSGWTTLPGGEVVINARADELESAGGLILAADFRLIALSVSDRDVTLEDEVTIRPMQSFDEGIWVNVHVLHHGNTVLAYSTERVPTVDDSAWLKVTFTPGSPGSFGAVSTALVRTADDDDAGVAILGDTVYLRRAPSQTLVGTTGYIPIYMDRFTFDGTTLTYVETFDITAGLYDPVLDAAGGTQEGTASVYGQFKLLNGQLVWLVVWDRSDEAFEVVTRQGYFFHFDEAGIVSQQVVEFSDPNLLINDAGGWDLWNGGGWWAATAFNGINDPDPAVGYVFVFGGGVLKSMLDDNSIAPWDGHLDDSDEGIPGRHKFMDDEGKIWRQVFTEAEAAAAGGVAASAPVFAGSGSVSTGESSSTGETVTLDTATQSGDAIVLGIALYSGTSPTVDSVSGLGATWTQLHREMPGGGGAELWIGTGVTAELTDIDYTLSGSTRNGAIACLMRGTDSDPVVLVPTPYTSFLTEEVWSEDQDAVDRVEMVATASGQAAVGLFFTGTGNGGQNVTVDSEEPQSWTEVPELVQLRFSGEWFSQMTMAYLTGLTSGEHAERSGIWTGNDRGVGLSVLLGSPPSRRGTMKAMLDDGSVVPVGVFVLESDGGDYIDFGESGGFSNTNAVVEVPAHTAGDLLLLVITSAAGLTPTAGWVLRGQVGELHVFTATGPGSGTGYSENFALAGLTWYRTACLVYAGVEFGDVVLEGPNASGTAVDYPEIGGTGRIVYVSSTGSLVTMPSEPGLTSRTNDQTGSSRYLAVSDRVGPGAAVSATQASSAGWDTATLLLSDL